MKRIFALLIGLISVAALAQTTFKAPDGAVITYSPPPAVITPIPPVVPPVIPPVTPPVTPPAAGMFWVYHNGVFAWPGDYSWNATINYKDTAGIPMDGPADIAVSIVAPWGGWQPFQIPSGTNGPGFDTSKYKTLHFCTKPTQVNETHGMGIDANNDVADGVQIAVVAGPDTTKYGPVPTVGKWGCYNVALADFKLTNPMIMKFSITDGTGNVPNKFYVDDVGFSP